MFSTCHCFRISVTRSLFHSIDLYGAQPVYHSPICTQVSVFLSRCLISRSLLLPEPLYLSASIMLSFCHMSPTWSDSAFCLVFVTGFVLPQSYSRVSEPLPLCLSVCLPLYLSLSESVTNWIHVILIGAVWIQANKRACTARNRPTRRSVQQTLSVI